MIIYHSFEQEVTAMEENKMQTFDNAQFGRLRTLEIDGDPWFVGRDVAAALGYAKPENALIAHVDPLHEFARHEIP